MKREELLRDPQWWLATIQNDLHAIIYEYMETNGVDRKDIASKLGVTKGYVTQVLKGDYDHKISKLVELALAFNKAPIVHFVDLDKLILDDGRSNQAVVETDESRLPQSN